MKPVRIESDNMMSLIVSRPTTVSVMVETLNIGSSHEEERQTIMVDGAIVAMWESFAGNCTPFQIRDKARAAFAVIEEALRDEPSLASDPDAVDIRDLELSWRVIEILERNNIRTVQQLARMTERELLLLPRFGRTAFFECQEALKRFRNEGVR